MNIKIIKNPDKTVYQTISEAVNENGGYCPCMFVKNEDARCPCREFREQQTEGECHCGRFIKKFE